MPTRHCFPTFAVLLIVCAAQARAADHLDAPLVQDDGRTDINDVYAFQSPTNADHPVLAMTVNPLAGVMSGLTFDSRANYDFNVDTNGDALADVILRVTFSKPSRQDDSQRVTLQAITGRGRGTLGKGDTGEDVDLRGGGTLRADLFEDPFYFDLNGFRNGLQFTGDDFFAGLNVTAIVVEVPSDLFGSDDIGVWCTTTVRRLQIDRMGRPAINTVLIPTARKDEFNQGHPADDFADFGGDVLARITALSGDANVAAMLTAVLLPDILTIDTSSSDGFLNGRRLQDDVIDAELSLLTLGAVTGDGVNANDAAFPGVFPYLAAPNPLP
jgi:hypothetical protein